MSESKRSKISCFLYYAIPIVFVFYVLSIGPVYALVSKKQYIVKSDPNYLRDSALSSSYNNLQDGFDFSYAPLLWAGEKKQLIEKILNNYMEFCYKSMYPEIYSDNEGVMWLDL